MAFGYARVKGKPMAAIVHNIVGLQHATMAIYNAWSSRVPVIVMGGTGPMDTTKRRSGADWVHTALVQGQQVRDYVKWDDQPASIASIPESFIRAYRIATSSPAGLLLCIGRSRDGKNAATRRDCDARFDPLPSALPLSCARGWV